MEDVVNKTSTLRRIRVVVLDEKGRIACRRTNHIHGVVIEVGRTTKILVVDTGAVCAGATDNNHVVYNV